MDHRAQLLQGLRTGGPRSASFGAPLSANPATTRFPSGPFQSQLDDHSAQMMDRLQNLNLNGSMPMSAHSEVGFNARLQQAQQQQQQLILLQAQAQVAAVMASQGGGPAAEAQAMQLQMEIMRLQALQQQQTFQTQMLLQQQLAAQQQVGQGRRLSEFQPATPATAGPLTSSFPDPAIAQTRSAAANQLRARAAGREASLKASLSDEQIAPPMSAGVTGQFAPRAPSSGLNPHAAAFVGRFNPELAAAIAAAPPATSPESSTPATPTYGKTTVISGGTSLGSAGSNNSLTSSASAGSYNGLSGYNNTAATGPTKSDSASSWRRGSATANTPVSTTPPAGLPKSPSPPLRQRSVSPPTAGLMSTGRPNVSTNLPGNFDGPMSARGAAIPLKIRPSPLRFGSQPTSAVPRSGSPGSGDGYDGSAADGASSKSSPTSSTPPSSAGSGAMTKEREEASKKLYEGLGIGRPAPSPVVTTFNPNAAPFTLNVNIPTFTTTAPTPIASGNQFPGTPSAQIGASAAAKVEPVRQPVGPPSNADEMGKMNFAARIRRKAAVGLGAVLRDARERRDNFVAQEVAAC